jgi:MarR family transcriptional regulator, transcriptional regulator for hemolysin
MQRSPSAIASSPDLRDQSALFEQHWEVLVRFIANRKLRPPHDAARDLTHVQLTAMSALFDHDLRMGDLAARLGIAESSVTRMVDRLDDAGLVERRAGKLDDRRCVLAGLTPVGRRLISKVRAGRRAFLGEILETLEPSDRAELVRLFGLVASALEDREEAGGR